MMENLDIPKRVNKPKSQSNHEYYVRHKEKNHRESLLSYIRTRGRVPLLRTAWKRQMSMLDVAEAWQIYMDKCLKEGVQIPRLKTMEMKVLIGNLM